MVDIQAAIAEIKALAGQADRTTRQTSKYKELITSLVKTPRFSSCTSLKALIDHLLSPDVPALVSRGVLSFLATEAVATLSKGSKNEDKEALRDVAEYALEKGAGHAQVFEDADVTFREYLFDFLKAEGSYKEAATVLAGLNLESVSRTFSDAQKAEIYVKIAETYLVEDEAVDAEAFVNRASGLMEAVTDYWVQLRYRVTYAKVLDANRKFLEAALRYHELSQAPRREIPPEELLLLLGKSVTCAILGKAGPQRSRILGTLHKDERTGTLESLEQHKAHAKVLEKMYMEQILTRTEMSEFGKSLQRHQTVKLADGFTILEKAIVEHNTVAASKVYDNIRFAELGRLLEVSESQAEKIAARMIGEGRLKGCIDQVDGVLTFEGGREGEAAAVLQGWDQKIAAACQGVNAILEEVSKSHPELLAPE
ncbi:cop9 signalosome complex subunit 4-like [Nannochloropsis oceanica]